MLIAVKALAVVCRNSVPNQAQALEHGLLAEAVRLFARGALRIDPSNPRRLLIDPGRDEPGEG